jgi:hypothetical protein
MSINLLGSLYAENGQGALRMEHRIAAHVDEVWAAMTDPARLSRWYGVVEGDLRPDVETRQPSRRLVVGQSVPGQAERRTEVTLTAGGNATVVLRLATSGRRGVPVGGQPWRR